MQTSPPSALRAYPEAADGPGVTPATSTATAAPAPQPAAPKAPAAAVPTLLTGANEPAPLASPLGHAKEVCVIARCSPATWWRKHANGEIPSPVKVGHKTLWRIAEIYRWIEAGCPARKTWEATERTRKAGRN